MNRDIESVTASPLDWPEGWPRTPADRRADGRFRALSFHRQCLEVLHEIELMGGMYTKISSNLKLRRDDLPYANQRRPDDVGVAAWFVMRHTRETKVIACDAFRTVEDNLRAIEKSVNALRGLERWGCSQILDRAMKGMAEDLLPAPPAWWEVLGVDQNADADVIRAKRVELAKQYHPDTGRGDNEKMKEINRAFLEAKRLGRV